MESESATTMVLSKTTGNIVGEDRQSLGNENDGKSENDKRSTVHRCSFKSVISIFKIKNVMGMVSKVSYLYSKLNYCISMASPEQLLTRPAGSLSTSERVANLSFNSHEIFENFVSFSSF
jgi:hypothetical protein